MAVTISLAVPCASAVMAMPQLVAGRVVGGLEEVSENSSKGRLVRRAHATSSLREGEGAVRVQAMLSCN